MVYYIVVDDRSEIIIIIVIVNYVLRLRHESRSLMTVRDHLLRGIPLNFRRAKLAFDDFRINDIRLNF